MIRTIVAAALVALPSAAFAQSPFPSPSPSASPAATDICSSGLNAVVSRPTQTTSACVVKPNQVLIEAGYQTQTAEISGGGSSTFQSVPNATIRIGTALRNIELQVLPPSAIRNAGLTVSSDVGAGVKWQAVSTPTFAFGVNTILTAPTGTDPARSPNGLGSANAATYVYNAQVQGSLGKVFGYSAGVGLQYLAAAGARYTSTVPSLGISASLPNGFAVVVEGFHATNGEGPATPGHTWLDAALEKVIGNAQIDLNYGVSDRVTPAPGVPGIRRRYAGFGISSLIP